MRAALSSCLIPKISYCQYTINDVRINDSVIVYWQHLVMVNIPEHPEIANQTDYRVCVYEQHFIPERVDDA